MNNLRSLGEDLLIEQLVQLMPTENLPGMAPGDDCAVFPSADPLVLQLLKTDALVEGVHYLPDENPFRIGKKAINRVSSDMAAMGGIPHAYLVTIAIPSDTSVDWLKALYQGMAGAMIRDGAILSGGETTCLPKNQAKVISIAALGSVKKSHLVLRSGGRIGDELWVTGSLGGSIRGKHLDFTPRSKEAAWLVEHFRPTAMMDLSDGLAKDLPRLAKASHCGFQLSYSQIPIEENCDLNQALSDGEDYELLFAMPPTDREALLKAWSDAWPNVPLSPIGKLVDPSESEILNGGWDHFQPPL